MPRFPKLFVPPRLFDRARPTYRLVARGALAGALAFSMALPARAQETPPAEAGAPPADKAPAPNVTPGELLPDGTYVVKQGDTLWDLSSQFLKNPWYWPKIWSENPEIENPHWIYPGNLLRVRGGAEGTPAEVTPAAPEEEPADQPGDEPLPPQRREVADFTVGDVSGADNLGAGDDLVSMSSSGRRNLNNGVLGSVIPGVILDRADSLGEIGQSFEPKSMLCALDRVFLKMKDAGKVRVGDRFTVVRDREAVAHPVDGRPLGRYSELIGNVRVLSTKGDDGVTAVIESCTLDISRGDQLVPGRDLFKGIARADSTKQVSGRIVYTAEHGATIMAEAHVVYLDKGKRDGVTDGNLFTVYQFGDGLDRGMPGKGGQGPKEAIGQVIVFDAQDATSAAIVVQAVRDVNIGDLVELGLPAGSSGDAR